LSARTRRRAAADPRLIRVVEILAVAGAAIFAALILLSFFSPLPDAPQTIVAAPAPEKLATVKSPFGETALAAAPQTAQADETIAETSLNLVLHGTWIDAAGGAAIIKTSSGDQKRFGRGDEIESGVTLQEVRRDQVVISRGGVAETLTLENREVAAAAAPSTSQSSVSFDGAGLATLGGAVRIVPRTDAVGAVRLTLSPGEAPVIFERLGLDAGDILVAIDGRDVGSDIAKEIESMRSLASRDSVNLTIERDGQQIQLTLPLAAVNEELTR
jgi:type II secretion system protein C